MNSGLSARKRSPPISEPIRISRGVFAAMLVVIVAMAAALVSGGFYVYGGKRELAGYALGCQAERMRNPAAQYIDSGQAFCYDGQFFPAKRTPAGFRIKR